MTPVTDQLLSVNKFEPDEETPHIVIDGLACRTCSGRACEGACPAGRYQWDDAGQMMTFDHVGCLECGNCRLVCERLYEGVSGYTWNYPGAGAGVYYRFG